MNNNIPVITDKKELYDKCENMEQLFDKYYLPLLDKHYSKVYQLQQENQKLKKQLEYLRSGEYYNQLRFERDMLQNVVDNGEVSKEDKEFIDMTHRNTELLEENQKLKKLLEEKNKHQIFIDTQDMEERYAEGLYQDYLEEENKKYKNQQKEFISYLEYQVKLQEELNDKLLATGFEEILSKYKSIIGGKE